MGGIAARRRQHFLFYHTEVTPVKKKLNCILLIDDDSPTNFLHEMVIEEMDCAEQVVSVESGEMALAFLNTEVDGQHPHPDLIFLDINMPAMNGWEFLEAYKTLDVKRQGKVIIVMLTTSLNPEDRDNAQKINQITGFLNKPLTAEALEQILKEHFFDQ